VPRNQKILSQHAISAPRQRIWWVGCVRVYFWRIFILQGRNLKKNILQGAKQKMAYITGGKTLLILNFLHI